MFANIAATPQTVKVNLDWRNAKRRSSCDVAICRPHSNDGFQPLWKNVSLPKELIRELAPLEVLFVELSNAAMD